MEVYKQIDFVLNFISITPFEKGGMTDTFILSKVEPVVSDANELHKILNHLHKDGFIQFEDREVEVLKSLYSIDKEKQIIRYYFATFEGRLFNESGGYVSQLKRNRLKEIEIKTDLFLRKRNDRRIVIGTILAGLGASGLVIWEMYKTFYLHR